VRHNRRHPLITNSRTNATARGTFFRKCIKGMSPVCWSQTLNIAHFR